MAELDKEIEQQPQEDVDYVEIIQQMKQTTVSKDKYDRLAEDNKKLMKALANGEQIEAEPEQGPDVDALRKDLFNADNQHTNLEFITKSLELRQALIDSGEKDPFLPWGQKITPDESDIATAERVADVLQQCVDYADGDNLVFTNELQRRMIDTAPRPTGRQGRR